MRTVKRVTLPLNAAKLGLLQAEANAYAQEKRYWLKQFEKVEIRPLIKLHRELRDQAIKAGYVSPNGLQARMWKLALIDAADTWDRHWKALFDKVRSAIGKRSDFTPEQRHYAFWLLSGYSQFFACLDGSVPTNSKIAVTEAGRVAVAHAVRRKTRQLRGRNPMVRLTRSFALDADCYDVFDLVSEVEIKTRRSVIAQNTQGARKAKKADLPFTPQPVPELTTGSTQAIALMSLERGKRIIVPLKGRTPITGNVRVVLVGSQVEIHLMQELAEFDLPEAAGTLEAVDMGYTEVFTDTQGAQYGQGFGDVLTAVSEQRHDVGKARNKLRALVQKYSASKSLKKRKKARHIKQYNLNNVKWDTRETRALLSLSTLINHALNTLIEARQPDTVISENLAHAFSFDKSKKVNRRMSGWVKGVMTDRIAFKALAKGFRHKQVNAAYTSQECPCCGFVDARNRSGDVFWCLHCRYRDHADRVAALNCLRRGEDPEITLYTPYKEIKATLMQRFYRRLETEGSVSPTVTVPGKTPDTQVLCASTAGTTSSKPSRATAKGSTTRGEDTHKACPRQYSQVPRRAKPNKANVPVTNSV